MSQTLHMYAQEGFTLSYRKKWFNPVFRNLLEAGIWAWMCDTAVWEPEGRDVRFNGALIHLHRGELVFSQRFISEAFCYGRQAVRTFLANLTSTHTVTHRLTHKATIVSICNYDKYQPQKNTGNPPTNPQANQIPTQKYNKEIRNKKEDYADAHARENFSELSLKIQTIVNSPIPLDTSPLRAWLEWGADPEIDIIPAIRRVLEQRGGNPPRSLKYFDGPIADAMANRNAPKPEVNHAPTNGTPKSGHQRGLESLATGLAEIERDIQAQNDEPAREMLHYAEDVRAFQ